MPERVRDGCLIYEETAREAGLVLKPVEDWSWEVTVDSPHITEFAYQVYVRSEAEPEDLVQVGVVDGYILSHDWTASDLQLWDEADAMDGDVCGYVDSLVRECRACAEVFAHNAASLHESRRTLIVRHVEAAEGVDSTDLIVKVVATLLLKETPTIVLVDPHLPNEERKTSIGKFTGRRHTSFLMHLGFVRMVGSRFLWGWSSEMAESRMDAFVYDKLSTEAKAGRLDAILKNRVADEVYGGKALVPDLPNPDELMQE